MVGWSDLLLFAIFENGRIAADQVYFYELIPKNRQRFHYQKITGSLKMNIFFKMCKYFLLYQRTLAKKENSKLKYLKHFILGPKNGQNGFLTWAKEKAKTIEFLFIFSQRRHSSLAQAPKAFFIVCPFKGKSQNFLRPCAKVKSNISK